MWLIHRGIKLYLLVIIYCNNAKIIITNIPITNAPPMMKKSCREDLANLCFFTTQGIRNHSFIKKKFKTYAVNILFYSGVSIPSYIRNFRINFTLFLYEFSIDPLTR